jgi:hypothetical protein
MIVLVDIPEGYTKVVTNPLDVEIATRLGWRLVAITENISTIPGAGITNYINGSQVTSYAPSSEVSTTNYVLQLDEESSLAIAGKERDEAIALTRDAQKTFTDVEKVVKETNARAERAEASLRTASESRNTSERRLNEERSARQRLEADLGKIRAAIGDVRYRELVASTEAERRDEKRRDENTAAQKKMY